MADSKHAAPGKTPAGKTPGYEVRDANTRAILNGGIILTAVVVFSFFYMRWLFGHYMRSIDRERPAVTELTEQHPMPPAPQLRVNAKLELAQLRAYEQGMLTVHEWIDKDGGVARIPIARAMAIVAERGLPAWPLVLAPDTNAVPAAADDAAPEATPAIAPSATGETP